MKILGWGENFGFGRVEKCDLYPTVAPALLFPNKRSVLMIVPRCYKLIVAQLPPKKIFAKKFRKKKFLKKNFESKNF